MGRESLLQNRVSIQDWCCEVLRFLGNAYMKLRIACVIYLEFPVTEFCTLKLCFGSEDIYAAYEIALG